MKSLRTQLVTTLLVIALVPLGGLAAYNSHLLGRALTDAVDQALLSSVSQTAARIDEFIDRNRDAVRTEAQLPALRKFLAASARDPKEGAELHDDALATLNALCRKDSVYVRSYALIDAKGQSLVDTDSTFRGVKEAEQPYFREALLSGRPYVSPVMIIRISGHGPSVFFSMAVSDATSTPLGVLRVEYDAAVIQRLVRESSEREGAESLFFLLDENGVCLAHSTRPTNVLKALHPISSDLSKELAAAGRLLQGVTSDTMPADTDLSADRVRGMPFFSFQQGGLQASKQYSAAAVPLRRFPWTLVAAKPTESFLVPVNAQLRGALALAIAISALVVLLGLGASALLTRPLLDLTRTAQRLAEGDLEARATIARGSEVGALAAAFNQMVQRLQESVADLRKAVNASERLSEERKRLIEELEHRNRELEGVLYATSHDLRAPLVNIQGFSQRVEKAVGDLAALPGMDEHARPLIEERIPKALHFIRTSVAKMDALISALLQLSRTNRAKLRIQILDMNAMLQSVFDSMAFQMQRVGASFRLDLLPPCVGDGEQINRVFSNLVDNAIKYRDPGRPLSLAVYAKVEEEMVTYTVADNGRGIAPEHQDQIWLLFHRLSPKESEVGEGLGLTLARRIVERHGGRIWVESTPGEGSRFHVSLPAQSREPGLTVHNGGGEAPNDANRLAEPGSAV